MINNRLLNSLAKPIIDESQPIPNTSSNWLKTFRFCQMKFNWIMKHVHVTVLFLYTPSQPSSSLPSSQSNTPSQMIPHWPPLSHNVWFGPHVYCEYRWIHIVIALRAVLCVLICDELRNSDMSGQYTAKWACASSHNYLRATLSGDKSRWPNVTKYQANPELHCLHMTYYSAGQGF